MNLYVNMVTKNEGNRYLESCLQWVLPYVDGIFIYDDLSEDNTVDIIKKYATNYAVRSESDASFLEEGKFRQRGWELMVENLGLESGDWVLGLDADEFVVKPSILKESAALADGKYCGSIDIKIHEIFDLNPLSERTDGFWGRIFGLRMMRYSRGPQFFRTQNLGSGVFPNYAYQCRTQRDSNIRILHYGYAEESDRLTKYQRYISIIENGHSDSHIQSIVTTPTLKPWDGVIPEAWRGVRAS